MINRTKTLIVASAFAAGMAALSGSAFAQRGYDTNKNSEFYALDQNTNYYALENNASRFAPQGQPATANGIDRRYPRALNQSEGGYNS